MTPLDKTLKRSLRINGVEYVIALSSETLKITRKGKRLGLELRWSDITSGESALAVALQASIGRFDTAENTHPAKKDPPKKDPPKKKAAKAVVIRRKAR
jgi:hypothetical protein